MCIISTQFSAYLRMISCVLLFCTIYLHSQGMTLSEARFLSCTPAIPGPVEELGLLPDTPSYYVIEEIYNADTLTRKGTSLTFHNYGDTRIAIYSDPNTSTYVDRIIKLKKVNDTLLLQTTTRFTRFSQEMDSTWVWWKNGLIDRASVIRHNRVQIDYTYEYIDNNLVRKSIRHSQFGKTTIKYSYDGDKVTKLEYRSADEKDVTDFQYSDTLITSQSISKFNTSVMRTNTYRHLDKSGREVSMRTYMQNENESDLKLYQSVDHTYDSDGGFRRTGTQHDQDHVSMVEFRPGYYDIERWTWKGNDQVWVKRYVRL